MEAKDRDLFIQFYHDGESYEGEADEWAKSKVGKRVKEIAEISFRAGKQEAFSSTNTQLEAALEEGKRRGIREVVEWLMSSRYAGDFFAVMEQKEADWRAKLKEWGIDEKHNSRH